MLIIHLQLKMILLGRVGRSKTGVKERDCVLKYTYYNTGPLIYLIPFDTTVMGRVHDHCEFNRGHKFTDIIISGLQNQ